MLKNTNGLTNSVALFGIGCVAGYFFSIRSLSSSLKKNDEKEIGGENNIFKTEALNTQLQQSLQGKRDIKVNTDKRIFKVCLTGNIVSVIMYIDQFRNIYYII